MQMRMKNPLAMILTVLVVTLTGAPAWANCGSDFLVSYQSRIESQLCTSPGYCYGTAINPENGQFEHFYGFHSDCQGAQQRPVEEYFCRRDDNTTYTIQREGFWGICDIVAGIRKQAPSLFVGN